jgi:hypothetical protein
MDTSLIFEPLNCKSQNIPLYFYDILGSESTIWISSIMILFPALFPSLFYFLTSFHPHSCPRLDTHINLYSGAYSFHLFKNQVTPLMPFMSMPSNDDFLLHCFNSAYKHRLFDLMKNTNIFHEISHSIYFYL